MDNGKPDLDRKYPVAIGAITAIIVAFVTTSFNDYMEFKESDAIHRLRIDQLKKEIVAHGSSMRRDLESIRVLISTNDSFYLKVLTNLSGHKDDFINRISRIEANLAKCEGSSDISDATRVNDIED